MNTDVQKRAIEQLRKLAAIDPAARICRECADIADTLEVAALSAPEPATPSTAPDAAEMRGARPETPPIGHPLQILGARLADLLQDDDWNGVEPMLDDVWKAIAPSSSAEEMRDATRYRIVRQVQDWSMNMEKARTPEEFDAAVDRKERP